MTKLIRTLLMGLPPGRSCRVCGEGIEGDDLFGLSEGVCKPCRYGS